MVHPVQRAVAGNPGVVDQHVDGAVIVHDLGHTGFAGFEIADIDLVNRDAGLRAEGGGGVVIAGVERRDAVPAVLEGCADRGADAACPARYDCYACQVRLLLSQICGSAPWCRMPLFIGGYNLAGIDVAQVICIFIR